MDTKPDYTIIPLSGNLVYIRWNRSPQRSAPSETKFIKEVRTILDMAEDKIYFISDLRKGRIVNVDVLLKLGQLVLHSHWGGSTAFSSNQLTKVFVDAYSRFAQKEKPQDEIWDTPEEAIGYLESLKEGITQNIDWNTVLGPQVTEV